MSTYKGLTEAQSRANAKYDAKTYKRFLFKLRIEDDKDIIKSLEKAMDKGITKREWLREQFEKKKK